MAIYTASAVASGERPVDIEAWTEGAIVAMSSVTISDAPLAPATPSPTHGSSVTLAIPLDNHPEQPQAASTAADASATAAISSGYVKRREPLRRDSLKRREALLKGKEGSRRRQRWENDRLLNNPYREPPLPSDWEIRPTYPRKNVPYVLAGLWEERMKAQSKKAAAKPVKKDATATASIPKDLREKLKRARGAKGLLQDLETQVRNFVEGFHEQEVKRAEQVTQAEAAAAEAKRQKDAKTLEDSWSNIEPDSEDEEIVFVGRNGQMKDNSPTASTVLQKPNQEAQREALVFESLEGDQAASFGRWLVHSIGTYYGLQTWSVTVGNPARREAYVGIKESQPKPGHGSLRDHRELPRPLWGMV